jgi:yihD like protein
MKCHRLNEVLELLQPYWSKEPDLHLLQILQKIADEAGFDKPVAELTDEVIIYHLKMCDKDRFEPIPGIKKDYEDDFKTALLKARGIIKE